MKKEVPVAAAVIFADDKVLAVQRGYGPGTGWWEFPGGKLEAGETHREALVRELEEELSIKVAVEEEIGTQKSVTADACYVITDRALDAGGLAYFGGGPCQDVAGDGPLLRGFEHLRL